MQPKSSCWREFLQVDIGTVTNGATGVSCAYKQGMQVHHYTEVWSTQQYSTDTVCQVNFPNLEITLSYREPKFSQVFDQVTPSYNS
jgi:hypothetical protein